MKKSENRQIKKAYKEILSVCEKYANEECLNGSNFRDIREMRDSALNHLKIVEWSEKYGIDIEHDKKINGNNHVKINSYMSIAYFKDAKAEKENGYGRYISWSDDNRQPENEWLICIGFSTGAYIFGDDYPTGIFQEFWNELKSYNPKYSDSHNHYLYFSVDKNTKIFSEFNIILKKYKEKNEEDYKIRKIKKMEEDLKKAKEKLLK